jgi:PDZ domain-containing protein
MRRRGVTVAVGALLLVVLLWQAGTQSVPYVELGPGPTVDTLGSAEGHPVISVSGAPTTDSAGQLRLVTVSVASELTLFDALRGWFQHDYAVVPRDVVYPPDKTDTQVDQEQTQQFVRSQTDAETAALRKLGYPVLVTVREVEKGAPADGVIAPGDVLTSVDGEPVTSRLKLGELIRGKPAGTARTVGFTHNGEAKTAALTPGRSDDGNLRIGVVVDNVQPHPFELKISLDKIGGPSAGGMFALGVIDKLDPVDLTGVMIIAGTGSIDEEGRIGPIGGIPQKLVAAKRDKAVAFLTPAANCAEAMRNAQPGLPLVKISSLDEALAALQALREKRQPPLCTR